MTNPVAASGDAGDTITYEAVIEHVTGTSTADAFDLVMTDALDPNLELVVGSVSVNPPAGSTVVSGNGGGDTTIEVRADTLALGSTLTITYQATLAQTVNPGTTVENTASLDHYDTLPADNDPNERDLGPVTSMASVSIFDTTLQKTIFATSEASTGTSQFNGSMEDLTIGEEVTFYITATLPEGTTPQVIIQDSLPASAAGVLEVVSANLVSLGGNLTAVNNPPNITISDVNLGDGRNDFVQFDFGQVTNTFDMVANASDEIVVEVVARVVDDSNNQSSDQLTNSALVQYGSGLNDSDTADIELVAPILTIDKSGNATTGDAGNTITFTIMVEHPSPASTADAFDVQMTDVIPAGMTYVPASLVDTGATSATSTDDTGGTITAAWDAFPLGSVGEIQFQVTLDTTVTPGQILTNTANLVWDSLPADADPNERAGSANNHHQVTISQPGMTKTVFATSEPTTGTEPPTLMNGPEVDLTIGEHVTYRFTVTFIEGTTFNTVIRDQLPAGTAALEVVSSQIVSIGGQLSAVPSLPAIGTAGAASDTNTDTVNDRVEWSLGDVLNTPDGVADANDQIEFEVVAVVRDDPLNNSGLDDLINTATLFFTGGSASDTALVDIVAPQVTVAKVNTIPGGSPAFVDAGDSTTFQLTLQHSGVSTADAFSLQITDVLDLDMVWVGDGTVVSDCTGLTTNSSGAPTIIFSIPTLSLTDMSCTITYQAQVDITAMPSDTLTNMADMIYDSTPVFVVGETRREMDMSNADLTVLAPGLVKVVTSTSLGDTGTAFHDPLLSDLTIGETVDYTLTIVFPEGTTQNAVITDTVQADANGVIEIIGASIISTGALVTTLPGTPVFSDNLLADGRNDTVVFDFGEVTNTPDGVNDTNDRITLSVTGRVIDTADNADGDTLTNQAQLTFNSGGPLSDSTDIDIVEPAVTLTKQLGPAVDNVITMTLQLTNNGTAPAYDIAIEDILNDSVWDTGAITPTSIPSGFTFSTSAGPGAGDTTITIASDGASAPPANSIEPSEVVAFTFTVPVLGGSAPRLP